MLALTLLVSSQNKAREPPVDKKGLLSPNRTPLEILAKEGKNTAKPENPWTRRRERPRPLTFLKKRAKRTKPSKIFLGMNAAKAPKSKKAPATRKQRGNPPPTLPKKTRIQGGRMTPFCFFFVCVCPIQPLSPTSSLEILEISKSVENKGESEHSLSRDSRECREISDL